jgi:ribosomal protein S27E
VYGYAVPTDFDLSPCPFCANVALTIATFGHEQAQFVVVTCSECGAMGPRASGGDPPGHAEFLWN